MRVSQQTKDEIARMKSSASSAKRDLMELERELRTLPGTKKIADELGSIIGRLEHWQTT